MVTPGPTLSEPALTGGGYRPGMGTDGIDREWDEPVYRQVAGLLRDRITSGEIEPRRPIPSIRTLVESYGIARATAGKAIKVLADEGLIHQVPGRGWFVTPQGGWPQA